MAQFDAHPTGDQEVAGWILAGLGNILLWRLIITCISMVILSLLIQEGHLSKECAQILANGLED